MASIAHIKPRSASLAVSIALMIPAFAQAASGVAAERPGAETVRPIGSAPHRLMAEGGAAAPGKSGIDRRDGAIAAGIFAGVLLLGLWGHLVVGGAVVAVATLGDAGARLVSRKPGRGRGWSDWPGPAVAPADRRNVDHRPLPRTSETNLVPRPGRTGRVGNAGLH
jgi:hypothetical protein